MTFKFFYGVARQTHRLRPRTSGGRRVEVFDNVTRRQFRQRMIDATVASRSGRWDIWDKEALRHDSAHSFRSFNSQRMPAEVMKRKIRRELTRGKGSMYLPPG
uniref:Uncharacterized protein n=1 Tax=Trypanosoma congolense (strain IL3000) TaxID=1068625 RepID=G0US80_TRYCI|nr:hypothetical protein, unlikely [Trypanosoma congolense IL3000]